MDSDLNLRSDLSERLWMCCLSDSNISTSCLPPAHSDLSDTSICITKWDATFPKMFPDEISDRVAHITWQLSFPRIELEYFYQFVFGKCWLTSLFICVSSTLGIKPWCFSMTASSLVYSSFLSSPARSLKFNQLSLGLPFVKSIISPEKGFLDFVKPLLCVGLLHVLDEGEEVVALPLELRARVHLRRHHLPSPLIIHWETLTILHLLPIRLMP